MDTVQVPNDLGPREDTAAISQILTLAVGDALHAVDMRDVVEILAGPVTTPLPGASRHVRGVFSHRGAVVPVFDLRERFGLEPLPYGPRSVVVVLRADTSKARVHRVGVLVDAIGDVQDLAADTVLPAPDLGVDYDGVAGLVTIDERMVVLFDGASLLDGRAPDRCSRETRA